MLPITISVITRCSITIAQASETLLKTSKTSVNIWDYSGQIEDSPGVILLENVNTPRKKYRYSPKYESFNLGLYL